MLFHRRNWFRLLLCSWLVLAGCATPPAVVSITPTPPQPTATSIPPTIPPTATIPSSPTPAPTQTPSFAIFSPLQGLAIPDLPAVVSNPYHPPKPGRDEPHAGVDLADRQPGTQVALSGREVDAVLSGRVAAVTHDRFPFGNALIVETPLSALPQPLLEQLSLPVVQPTLAPSGPLTCPTTEIPTAWDFSQPSLYLLYAHLQSAPQVQPGDKVTGGQPLGQVGQTGNALVPHLHLEVRIGPGGASFASLSHYTDSATPDEMAHYCAWTVSGLFQLVDPLKLFQ